MADTAKAEATKANAGRPTGFAHMLLKVSDIARSERFYVEVLGFTVRPAKPLPDGRPFVPFHQGLALTSGGPREPPPRLVVDNASTALAIVTPKAEGIAHVILAVEDSGTPSLTTS